MIVAELVTKLGFSIDPRELDRGIHQAQRSLSKFKSFLVGLALGAVLYKVGRNFIMTARELETMNAQLLTMTGSSEKANMLFSGITNYAKQTAFYMKDALGATINLLQGQVGSGDVMTRVQWLGDVASNSAQLRRLAMAYGRSNQRGYMSGKELQRFQEGGGFNPLQQLALMQTEQAGLMRKGDEVLRGSNAERYMRARQDELMELMKKKKITIGMVDEALKYATTKGGIYFEHQKHQLQTFEGAYTNMLDNISINFGLAFMKLSPLAQKVMNAITATDFTKLPGIFEKIAHAIQYMWSVMVQYGVVDSFNALKQSVLDFQVAFQRMIGGQAGAGNALKTTAIALAYLLRMLMFAVATYMRVYTMLMNVIGPYITLLHRLFTTVKYLAGSIWSLVRSFWGFLTATQTVAVPAVNGVGSAFDAIRTIMLAVIKTAKDLGKEFTELAFGPLGRLVVKLWEGVSAAANLGAALIEKERMDEMADRNARLEAEADKTLELQLKQREYKKAHNGEIDNMLATQITESLARQQSIRDEELGPFGKFSKEITWSAAASEKALAALEAIQKNTGEIAGNTDPRARGGFDELTLLQTALRGRLPDQLLATVAEYD